MDVRFAISVGLLDIVRPDESFKTKTTYYQDPIT
jgi:hypothetical protein